MKSLTLIAFLFSTTLHATPECDYWKARSVELNQDIVKVEARLETCKEEACVDRLQVLLDSLRAELESVSELVVENCY